MKPIHVFILAGQSNMQGFGHIEGYPVLEDDRIYNLATGHAEKAVEPLHHWDEHTMPDGIGLGLAMPFALRLLKTHPDLRIGFIPAARGGSYLDEWMPGAPNFERAIALYERAQANVEGLELAGLLWHQGEADSSKKELAQSYGDRFLATMTGFRNRLGEPDLPVVVGELGQFLYRSTYYSEYKTVVAQTRTAIASLKHAAYVSSEGLEVDEGNVHIGTESIREFGLRYAEAYLCLISGSV